MDGEKPAQSAPNPGELEETLGVASKEGVAGEDSVGTRGLTRVDEGEEDEGLLKKAAVYRVSTLFKDVVGLLDAKRLIEDEVILPLKRPEVYARYGKLIGGFTPHA